MSEQVVLLLDKKFSKKVEGLLLPNNFIKILPLFETINLVAFNKLTVVIKF